MTRLHDTWIAGMADPVKGGGKRYGMAEAKKTKLIKEQQRARDEEKAKKKAARK